MLSALSIAVLSRPTAFTAIPGLYLPAQYTGLDLPGGALCILRKLYSSGHCSSYQATKMTTSGGEKFTRHINAISFLSWITWCYKLLKQKHNFRKSIKLVQFFRIVSRSLPYSQQMRSQYCFPYQQRNVFGRLPFTLHLQIRYKSLSQSLPSICITSVKLSAP